MKSSVFALYCLCAVAGVFVLSATGMMCGYAVNAAYLPVTMAVVAVVMLACKGLAPGLAARAWALAAAVAVVIICVGAASMVSDYSYDGNFYHQEVVALLVRGWNPYNIAELTPDHSLWANHYAIGQEIVAAAFAKTACGHIEAGKSANLVVVASALALVYGVVAPALQEKKLWRRRVVAILVATAVVGSPVVVSQTLTFYVDWAVYAYLVIMLVCVWHIAQGNNGMYVPMAAMTAILAVATKFNAFFDVAVLGAVSVLWLIVTRRRRAARVLFFAGVAGILAGLALCLHPYWHNFQTGGNPLYPLMGGSAVDIMGHNTPERLGCGRVPDFFISLFSVSIPKVDQRVGGFGPLMPVILAVSVLIFYRMRKCKGMIAWTIAATLVFASCFIFEQSWWARYISQLWLVPSLALVAAYGKGAVCRLRAVLLTLMLATAVFAAAYVGGAAYRQTVFRRTLYDVLPHGAPLSVVDLSPQCAQHFETHGISAVSVPETDIPDGTQAISFYGFDGERPYAPKILTDSCTRDEIIRRMSRRKIVVEPYVFNSKDN